ncbi:MAG TPA: hypothetical protein DCP90_05100 [Clostridiales bacterium]|nr:MAG: hypothetical protein A2Y22_09105 [Clostridiales bacterium GWD2_32_59]HAN09976.1 hypothetical protein [Clostridiales bacterium]
MSNLKAKQKRSNESQLIANLSLYMQSSRDEKDFFDRLIGLMIAQNNSESMLIENMLSILGVDPNECNEEYFESMHKLMGAFLYTASAEFMNGTVLSPGCIPECRAIFETSNREYFTKGMGTCITKLKLMHNYCFFSDIFENNATAEKYTYVFNSVGKITGQSIVDFITKLDSLEPQIAENIYFNGSLFKPSLIEQEYLIKNIDNISTKLIDFNSVFGISQYWSKNIAGIDHNLNIEEYNQTAEKFNNTRTDCKMKTYEQLEVNLNYVISCDINVLTSNGCSVYVVKKLGQSDNIEEDIKEYLHVSHDEVL